MGELWLATMFWSSSIKTLLALDVPRSIPKYIVSPDGLRDVFNQLFIPVHRYVQPETTAEHSPDRGAE